MPSNTGKLPALRDQRLIRSRNWNTGFREVGNWWGIPPIAREGRRSGPARRQLAMRHSLPSPTMRQPERHTVRLPPRKPDCRAAVPATRGLLRNEIWSGVSCRVHETGWRAEICGSVERAESEAGLATAGRAILSDAGKSRLVPPRDLVSEVEERLVFLDRPAERYAGLHARVGRIREPC